MEQPVYLRRLIEQKYILIVGAVVAIVAGFMAGFAVVDGEVVSRATKTYTASSTVLLTAPVPDYFQVQIPGETQAVPVDDEGNPTEQELIVTQATPIDLTDSAIILAYMAASDDIEVAVAEEVGGLREGEAVTAVRRTTQPTGDERFGGRLELPILEIAGIAATGDRAEMIAAAATAAFADMVLAQQEEWGVAEDIRLTLDELNAPEAEEVDGSNPAIPIVVVGFGVFLLFIALALIVGAIREALRTRRQRAGDASGQAAGSKGDAPGDDASAASVTPKAGAAGTTAGTDVTPSFDDVVLQRPSGGAEPPLARRHGASGAKRDSADASPASRS